MVQIRELPEDVHRTLKARAAARGITLSEYLRLEVVRLARSATADELDERIRARGPAGVSTSDILEARASSRHA